VRTALVSIETGGRPLDGAFHEPEGGATRGAALLFHGNTMNFYTGALRFLPPALTALGYACLAFNRRGRDILGIRDSRAAEGAAFQLVAEAVEDNRSAARWLAARGYAHPVVIGHSNGGTLAVQHVADHPQTPALVLLSAHCGGTNMVKLASKRGLLGGERLEALTTQARDMVAAGRGRELMLLPGWWYVVSAESFLDLQTNLPDVLALAPRIACPTLYLCGDEEPTDLYPAAAFAARAAGEVAVDIVPRCGHFYVGREDEVTARVTRWLEAAMATVH
jgi:pimeloyl-ACP methyl ester carboxylesterase